MAEGMGRRDVFKEALRSAFRLPAPVDDLSKEAGSSFFDSVTNSYSITLAYPWELLAETARRMGLPTDGKTRLELAREIFSHQVMEDGGIEEGGAG